MTFLQEDSKKRLHTGQLKLLAQDKKTIIDLTNSSDEESSTSSKRAKSTSLGPDRKTSLPYISSKPPSSAPIKTRFSTPTNEIFIKKRANRPLFKSPPWQNRKFLVQDGARSPVAGTPTPTAAPAGPSQVPKCTASGFPKNARRDSINLLPYPPSQVKSEPHSPSKNGCSDEPTSEPYPTKQAQDYHHSSTDSSEPAQNLLSARRHSNHKRFVNQERQISKTGSLPRAQSKPPTITSAYPVLRRTSRRVGRPQSATSTSRLSPDSSSYGITKPNLNNSKQKASFKAKSINSPSTPSRPTVVVEINNPPYKSASRTLLEKFRQPLPRPKSATTSKANVRSAKKQKEAQLLTELKRDTTIAQSRASSVEELFGSHGLSKHYNDACTIDQRRSLQVAQTKAKRVKRVKRSEIKLDWGAPVIAIARTFKPADVIPPSEQAKRLLDLKFQDVSGGAPLTFVNERNSMQISGKFQFVDSYVQRGLREIARKSHVVSPEIGCTCSGQCESDDGACRCLRVADGSVRPYIRRDDGLVTLNHHFIDTVGFAPQEIFECNSSCQCSGDCFNTVVQKGRTVPLQIFMTERCGFGIRSPEPIKKGQFIDVYLGELLSTKAIEEYENASTEMSSSYVFSLDFFGPASYHIQGLHFGSPTRFINHSCKPNTRTFTVMMNHADQKVYKLAYFAIRDIPAMKEITFDYSPETADEEPWVPTPGEEDEAVVRCLCGEKNCRGRVWPKRQTARRKGRGWART
ncbi:hypothetical protein GJ744_009830 [Endocarpon pusillum]|uniref:Histone-lysine N-methyltransferase n=1 Tax=Endocarpon pusillum TaxID=364733 RepID=A0A8H7ATT1_9EURO|nr:hypothetical protein GJ744_009830 [Endocarpon pusillum]